MKEKSPAFYAVFRVFGISSEGDISLPVYLSRRTRATTQPFYIHQMRQRLVQILRNSISIAFKNSCSASKTTPHSLCRPRGFWGCWGGFPNPVAYAHRQRSAALWAEIKQPDLYGRSTTFASLRLCVFAFISSSRISAGDPLRG